MRVSAAGLVWLAAALAAVSVGLHAGPLPWRFAGESGLAAPGPVPAATSAASTVSIEPILALSPFGRLVEPGEPEAPAEETSLGLTLHGVVIADQAEASSAIISGPSGPARSYAVGQEIVAAATLAEVRGGYVVLRVDGRREVLSFPVERRAGASAGSGGAAALRALVTGGGNAAPAADSGSDEPEAVIARYRDRIQANPQTVLDDLGLVATDQGYRVAGSASNSVRRAGLNPGDVVEKVNGQQVGNIEQDRRLFDEVAASGHARIEVLRNGQRVVMSFPLR